MSIQIKSYCALNNDVFINSYWIWTLVITFISLLGNIWDVSGYDQAVIESVTEKNEDSPATLNPSENEEDKTGKDSVELSDLTENSNKYFGKIEKIIYNFFKTIKLAIPIFVIILLCGLLFKVAAAPFHLWVLDIYEGSPTSSTLIFAVLIKICYYCFYAFFVKDLSQCINLTGLFSIFIGSVVGLSERKIKSLLTFSSIK